VKTSVRMTLAMQQELRAAASAAYGGKGKSRWVREALEMLDAQDEAMTSVGLGEAQFVPECAEQFLLSAEAMDRLEAMVSRVRRQDPLSEGVQSQVLRAAIRWRLSRT
jgi:predicted DNA-binding protein